METSEQRAWPRAGAESPGSVETETVACALCGGSDGRPLFLSRDLRYETTPRNEFILVECVDCGLRYLNPRPTEAALAAFYPESYYSHRPAEPSPRRGLLRRLYPPRSERIIQEKIRRAVPLLPAGGAFIEYGPSAGQFLRALGRMGFTGIGIERSGAMVRHIRERLGMECYEPDELRDSAREPVHLVVLWNVFEHLADPVGFLRWTRNALLPRGWILFSVPNAAALERSLFFRGEPCEDIPRHLYAYSPTTIRRLLEGQGFDGIRIEQATLVSMSELQQSMERIIFRSPGFRAARKVLYTGIALPLLWAFDRGAALLGRSHTMVVSARRP